MQGLHLQIHAAQAVFPGIAEASLDEDLREACMDSAVQNALGSHKQSSGEKMVLHAAHKLVHGSVKITPGAMVCGGTRATDALLEWPGGAAALEVDGPRHYLQDSDTRLLTERTGQTVLRDFALRQAGLKLARVKLAPVKLGGHCQRGQVKQSVLEDVLQQAGVPLAGSKVASKQRHGGSAAVESVDAAKSGGAAALSGDAARSVVVQAWHVAVAQQAARLPARVQR